MRRSTLEQAVYLRPDAIEDVRHEGEDGYWATLKPGFRVLTDPVAPLHEIHEWKARRFLDAVLLIVPCKCDECRKAVQP